MELKSVSKRPGINFLYKHTPEERLVCRIDNKIYQNLTYHFCNLSLKREGRSSFSYIEMYSSSSTSYSSERNYQATNNKPFGANCVVNTRTNKVCCVNAVLNANVENCSTSQTTNTTMTKWSSLQELKTKSSENTLFYTLRNFILYNHTHWLFNCTHTHTYLFTTYLSRSAEFLTMCARLISYLQHERYWVRTHSRVLWMRDRAIGGGDWLVGWLVGRPVVVVSWLVQVVTALVRSTGRHVVAYNRLLIFYRLLFYRLQF